MIFFLILFEILIVWFNSSFIFFVKVESLIAFRLVFILSSQIFNDECKSKAAASSEHHTLFRTVTRCASASPNGSVRCGWTAGAYAAPPTRASPRS